MSIRFDSSEVRGVAEVFADASKVAPAEARKVVSKGALNIKNDARRRASGIAHAPAYPNSITYDTQQTATGASAEIGPDKSRRQGALGNVLEYGTVKNAPIPHHAPAAEAERPRFEKAMEDAAAKALGGLA